MTCQTCGRPAENGQATHWLGCEAVFPKAEPVEEPGRADPCEHDGCTSPKWSDGPRTKYCVDHKDPKSREK
jgi:hypothetical protein